MFTGQPTPALPPAEMNRLLAHTGMMSGVPGVMATPYDISRGVNTQQAADMSAGLPTARAPWQTPEEYGHAQRLADYQRRSGAARAEAIGNSELPGYHDAPIGAGEREAEIQGNMDRYGMSRQEAEQMAGPAVRPLTHSETGLAQVQHEQKVQDAMMRNPSLTREEAEASVGPLDTTSTAGIDIARDRAANWRPPSVRPMTVPGNLGMIGGEEDAFARRAADRIANGPSPRDIVAGRSAERIAEEQRARSEQGRLADMQAEDPERYNYMRNRWGGEKTNIPAFGPNETPAMPRPGMINDTLYETRGWKPGAYADINARRRHRMEQRAFNRWNVYQGAAREKQARSDRLEYRRAEQARRMAGYPLSFGDALTQAAWQDPLNAAAILGPQAINRARVGIEGGRLAVEQGKLGLAAGSANAANRLGMVRAWNEAQSNAVKARQADEQRRAREQAMIDERINAYHSDPANAGRTPEELRDMAVDELERTHPGFGRAEPISGSMYTPPFPGMPQPGEPTSMMGGPAPGPPPHVGPATPFNPNAPVRPATVPPPPEPVPAPASAAATPPVAPAPTTVRPAGLDRGAALNTLDQVRSDKRYADTPDLVPGVAVTRFALGSSGPKTVTAANAKSLAESYDMTPKELAGSMMDAIEDETARADFGLDKAAKEVRRKIPAKMKYTPEEGDIRGWKRVTAIAMQNPAVKRWLEMYSALTNSSPINVLMNNPTITFRLTGLAGKPQPAPPVPIGVPQ